MCILARPRSFKVTGFCMNQSLYIKGKGEGKDIAVRNQNQHTTMEITCDMGSHSVTCHPAAATFPPSVVLLKIISNVMHVI